MTGGGGGDDEVESDLAAFGIAPPERIEEESDDDWFDVWPENWETVRLFALLDDSWRRNGISGRVEGMRWETAESVMRMMDVADMKETFLGLKVMAVAAMPLLNRK